MSTEQSEPGHLLAGRYRMSHLIGEGGMGRVWQGSDELLDRPVAIKELTLSTHLPKHEVEILRTRMLREARSAAQLSHPSIITVFDVVEGDDRPWIVMELVRGHSLSELIKEHGTLQPVRMAGIGLQVVAALALAHSRGVVHRDIKPGNVLVAKDDRAVLTDFGIARLEGSTSLTNTGNLLGSPNYLAPEQARGEPAGPATDMWALGVTLYAAVEGTPPFQRSSPMATLTAVVTEDVPPPEAAGPLRPVLEGLLRKDPGRRLTVEQAREALYRVAAMDPEEARAVRDGGPEPTGNTASFAAAPAPAPAPPGPGAGSGPGDPQRYARYVLAAVLAVVALVVVAGLALWLGRETSAESTGGGAGGSSAGTEAGLADSAESAGQEEPADGAEESPEPEEAGPPMARHEDETGFSLDVPEGWEVERRDGGVFFTDPAGGYLQVDQTDDPGDNAKEDWEAQEGAISANFGGYELVSITALDEPYLDDYVSAADWEFAFDGSGGRMHAVNRAFHTEEKGYALFLVSPEEDWEADRALLDEMTRSFEPAG
ncbi:tRNA A-37 threonylcarbamoyl transferase component Bud32 [Spinactinospora alkalitolerans]|uniref:non-specific serine/threonine protein kinase n=1 Tax=Spinactinospora alkalitolerans TaxID=687207 RepID=A0A852U1S3_9ACTN|nr:serine/threonine-protein kinase [Spinactinospora alkalitolerans]NYE50168.1 tRNA A-37 threonylcarbamoyl transferase component Bud32 [Spinactinospora alkalitolerans]